MTKQIPIYLQASVNDGFVGFIYEDNKITLCFPYALGINSSADRNVLLHFEKDKEKIRILSFFFQSFKLAEAEEKVFDRSPSINNDNESRDYPLQAYQYMIDDYRRNGKYIEFEKRNVVNGNGKINWKKTFALRPFFDDDNVYYLNVVTEQKYIYSGVLDEIYQFCVYESIYKFGSWFYGMNCNSIQTKNKRIKTSVKKKYIYILKNKIAQTFDDDLTAKLQNMLMIVNGANDGLGLQKMGLKTYHSVFEKLIKWSLGNVDNLDKYNPKAHWSEGNDPLSSLRLDALRIENDSAYIIDAKFYQSSKPETSDINKQITYGENLFVNRENLSDEEHSYDKYKIYNLFILPCCDKDKPLIYDSKIVGIANWRSNNYSFEKIHLLFINMKELLFAWHNNNQTTFLNDFKTIESSL